MVVNHSVSGPSPSVQRRIAAHRIEVARQRAELGDPEEALSAFVREHFNRDALAAVLRDERDHSSQALDDETDRAVDG